MAVAPALESASARTATASDSGLGSSVDGDDGSSSNGNEEENEEEEEKSPVSDCDECQHWSMAPEEWRVVKVRSLSFCSTTKNECRLGLTLCALIVTLGLGKKTQRTSLFLAGKTCLEVELFPVLRTRVHADRKEWAKSENRMGKILRARGKLTKPITLFKWGRKMITIGNWTATVFSERSEFQEKKTWILAQPLSFLFNH